MLVCNWSNPIFMGFWLLFLASFFRWPSFSVICVLKLTNFWPYSTDYYPNDGNYEAKITKYRQQISMITAGL